MYVNILFSFLGKKSSHWNSTMFVCFLTCNIMGYVKGVCGYS